MTALPPEQPKHRNRPGGSRRFLTMAPEQLCAVLAVALLLVLAIGGLVRQVAHHRDQALPPTPPSPSASASPSAAAVASIGRSTTLPSPTRSSTSARAPGTCQKARGDRFGGTSPVQVCLPSIHVDASVMQLGLNADRTVQVPPLSRVRDAGWYKYSAAPGTKGPTVILGHVDSAQYGTGVFFRLGQLAAGDRVVITRGDGKVATYRITRVTEVSKSHFPSQAVYGPTTSRVIRLVTCGGRFDAATGNYLDNIIAFGALQSLQG